MHIAGEVFPTLALEFREAAVGLTFSGDLQANRQSRVVFQAFSLALMALSAGYFAACCVRVGRQFAKPLAGRRALLEIVLAVAGALGWIAASNLYRYAREIETMLGAVMYPRSRPESGGFSGQGRLGSVARQKANAGGHIALRVYAHGPPGYLRGRAFDTYDGAQWSVKVERTTLVPDRDRDSPLSVAAGQRGGRTFSLIRPHSDAWKRLEIWPNQPFQQVVFAPLGLAALQIPADKLSIDVHGIIQADDLPSGAAYVAWTSEEVTWLSAKGADRDDRAVAHATGRLPWLSFR